MNIAIIGSREGFDQETVTTELTKRWIHKVKPNLISGGARGIDTYVEIFAKQHNIPIEIIRPINPACKQDYIIRNFKIVDKADKVLAFWDGKSKGTKSVIDYCKKQNKEIQVITLENGELTK